MIFFLLLQVVFAYNETVSRQSAYLSHLTYCNINTCDNCIVDYIVENLDSGHPRRPTVRARSKCGNCRYYVSP